MEEHLSAEEHAKIEMGMKFWGTLIAHINGFAAINSFSELQQLSWFVDSPLQASVIILLAFVVIFGMFQALDWYRERQAMLDGLFGW